MNESEHLLTCLAEECAEVQQAVAKALRFGLTDGYPNTERTNAGDIADELTDLTAVVEMLQTRGIIRRPAYHDDRVTRKIEKVTKFMAYAQGTGALAPNASDKHDSVL